MRIYDDESIKMRQKAPTSPTEQTLNERELGQINGMVLNRSSVVIGEKEIKEALGVLNKYRSGKAQLESRIIDEENFYMLQYNRRATTKNGKDRKDDGETPSSAWLFNSIQNKHADAMDNYPEPHCLPRELSDEEEADKLNSILPVVLEQNDFEHTYSLAWWDKLKHGTSVYSVLWNPELENGLGNIDIGRCDILNLYWDMSCDDIQQSANVFYVALEDNESLEAKYPQLKGKLKGTPGEYKRYNHNTADISEKTMVIDWYYKRKINGQNVVHYCKFVENYVLYASENDPKYALGGFYDHGKYPFVLDVLFPEAGSAAGFGIIAIGRDSQIYIDLVDKAIINNAMRASTPRWLAGENCGINTDEWLDWNIPIVHAQGSADVSEQKFRNIENPPLPSYIRELKQAKIDELKETTSNRDFSNGATNSGVTSGAAIAVLQESGSKTSRDMIKSSYRNYRELIELEIELIRQFYTEERSFRITAPNGVAEFISYNNSGLQPQMQTMDVDGRQIPIEIGQNEVGAPEYAVRIPIIDISIKAQKQNPFTTMAQNETAMNMYNAGFFEPERAQQALVCLEMMDFEGKEKVLDYVQQGQTLMNQLQILNNQILQASQMLASANINPMNFGLVPMDMMDGGSHGPASVAGNPISTASGNAVDLQSGYTKNLVEKARPSV